MRGTIKKTGYEQVNISITEAKRIVKETNDKLAWGTWYRVFSPDGSTIAYCPDCATADTIAKAIDGEEAPHRNPHKEKAT